MTPRARLDVRRNGVPPRNLSRRALVAMAVLLAAAAGRGAVPAAQEQGRHEITITAKRYDFSPPRIEVAANDVVKITLVVEDIPHSFTIDEYRISKRAAPGRPVTFEFRADKAGSFPFFCNLTIDDGCRQMRGQLVVTPRRP
jgi:heme/copper-type cytochrome/quinol oxidase subunit 2